MTRPHLISLAMNVASSHVGALTENFYKRGINQERSSWYCQLYTTKTPLAGEYNTTNEPLYSISGQTDGYRTTASAY